MTQTVKKMAISSENFLSDSIQKDFCDATVDRLEDIVKVLEGWHRAGGSGGTEEEERGTTMAVTVEEIDGGGGGGTVGPRDGGTKFCVYCGTKVPMVAKFCSSCGERQPEL